MLAILLIGFSLFQSPSAGAATAQVDSWFGPRLLEATFSSNVPLSVGGESGVLDFAYGFSGHMQQPHNYGGQLDALAYTTTLEAYGMELTVGKAAYRLGRGRMGTLLSGGELPGYPGLAYRISRPRLEYTKIAGDLDHNDGYRRLGVHYVTYQLMPRLNVGAGEIYVRSQPFAGDIFYDLLPVLPYYFHKYAPGVPSGPGNNLIYVDAELVLDRATVYGEFLVNEFPALLGHTSNPFLYGVLVGAEYGALTLEYARVSNYAYSNADPLTVYSYQGRGLGHWLETDGDVFDARWKLPLAADLDFTVGGFVRRRGEAEVDDWTNSAAVRQANAFLSGTPTQTIGAVGRLDYRLRHETNAWDAYAEMKMGPISNADHVSGKSGLFYEILVGVSVATF